MITIQESVTAEGLISKVVTFIGIESIIDDAFIVHHPGKLLKMGVLAA